MKEEKENVFDINLLMWICLRYSKSKSAAMSTSPSSAEMTMAPTEKVNAVL
jgi:hypothetical protein